MRVENAFVLYWVCLDSAQIARGLSGRRPGRKNGQIIASTAEFQPLSSLYADMDMCNYNEWTHSDALYEGYVHRRSLC
jgi:hypothetical protein